MKAWTVWTVAALAAGMGLLIGAVLGAWLFFKVYGGADQQIVSHFADEATVIELAARDGLNAADSELVRNFLPRLQQRTANLAFISAGSLGEPYPQLMRDHLQRLTKNPLVAADTGPWAEVARESRECILLMPPERNDWMSCRRVVKKLWPKAPPGSPLPVPVDAD